MLCDVMPTISEDSNSQGDRDSQISGEGANVEEMLLSMLDERDRLMEGLKEVQEQLVVTQGKFEQCQREKDSLQKQISDTMPQEVATLTKEVSRLRQLLGQKDEEITDLKAERNNTRLLLEHLECLVSRHERSLRMTVVKRQVVNPAGVSSEVEVLKALKSLFEHHKALDEKVRERLKVAVDKSSQLEEEVSRLRAELECYKNNDACTINIQVDSSFGHSKSDNISSLMSPSMVTSDYVNVPTNGPKANSNLQVNNCLLQRSPSFGLLSPNKPSSSYSDLLKLEKATTAITQQQIVAFQDLIDQLNSELLSVRKEVIEKTTRIRELEDTLSIASKDLKNTLEQLESIQQQLNESEAKRGDQEQRIETLEKRYEMSQRDMAVALDDSDKAKSDVAMKVTELKHMEDRLNQMRTRLDQTEAHLVHSKSATNDGVTSEITSAAATVAQRRRSGNQVVEIVEDDTGEVHSNRLIQKKKENIYAANELLLSIAEDKILQYETRIAEAEGELCRAAQRDKLNEEHNNRLTGTVSKLLAESNERLQSHLDEKMHNLKEKNDLNSELDRIRRILETTKSERDTLLKQTLWLKDQISEMSESTMHMRQQIESLRTALIIAREQVEAEHLYNESLTRDIDNLCDSPTRPDLVSMYPGDNWASSKTHSKPMDTEEKEDQFNSEYHDNMYGEPEAHNSTNPDNQDDSRSSPTGASDAKALALMIQEQLDSINNEIRLIQEEKETTEQRADELESRVGSSANMGMIGSWSPPPPINGRSSPESAPSNWQHQPISGTRQMIRKNIAMFPENISNQNWSIGKYSSSTPHLSHDRNFAENHDGLLPKYNPYNRLSEYLGTMEMTNMLANLPEEISDGRNDRQVDTHSPTDEIVEPRHIRCESSPPITPCINRPAINSSISNTPKNQSDFHERTLQFSQQPTVISPQSSPSSGSQDSLQNPSLCVGMPKADSGNGTDRKRSRITTTLSRIFKKDRNKDVRYSGDRLEIGSPVPSAVTQMSNFQNIYRQPAQVYVRPLSVALPPHQHFSHRQYYASHNNIHAAMQQKVGNNDENAQSSVDPRDTPLGGSNTLPLGKQMEEKRRKKKEELLDEVMDAKTPFTFWNGPTIVAWLELWVKMPAWYVAACRANVKSGAVMASLNDQEIQREIGISNSLHRLKLRLAIQEMVAVTNRSVGAKMTVTPLVYGDMDHEWIGQDWLPSLDLGQYKSAFMENLVDARMLEHLTKRDLRNLLKMVDGFHRSSLQFGISLLRRINYSRAELERRRNACASDNTDVVVWTHDRVVRWLNSIGLKEFTVNIKDSGLHGAILTLDNELDSNAIALLLQIPSQNGPLRSRLDKELALLLQPYRSVGLFTATDGHLYSHSRTPEYPPDDDEFDADRESNS